MRMRAKARVRVGFRTAARVRVIAEGLTKAAHGQEATPALG